MRVKTPYYFLLFLAIILIEPEGISQVSFSYRSQFRYVKGKDASMLSSVWSNKDYNDLSWSTGNAPFRYGDGSWGVELTDMLNSYSTLYLRSSFSCANTSGIEVVTFTIDYDDGFVLWINGIEALRRNAPSTLTSSSVATANHESGTGEVVNINPAAINLQNGLNSIAVQALNVSLTSTDFYFDMAIEAEVELPAYPFSIPVSFSEKSGFYNNPFTLQLSIPDTSARIVYTLDGSNPQTSINRIIAETPCNFLIDPEDTTGRDKTPAVIIRASALKEGFSPNLPESRTYIFTENVKRQVLPGGKWPNSNINGQLIDLEMDTRITEGPLYSGFINKALIDIPVVSIITDIKNLFDPQGGIYVNAEGHGFNWEKECSVELFDPEEVEDGFIINAGLRIRGGYSRHDSYPKHAFRLFFRGKYGVTKLNFPLFGPEGTDEFDKIDLRAEQNYSWNNGSQNNSLVREVFSRDTQRDMGQPYTRSRYYHLYLNGMYWGVYMTQERSEANFAESYFGDDDEDYDVIKVNTENYTYNIEATDGNLSSWQKIWNMCISGFESNSNYFKLEGKDKNGNPVKGGEVMVDIDNLIDYMMVIFYTGNFDAPTSSFMKNKGCNNFFAIDNREDKSKGFVFFAHDSEHSLFDEPHTPGVGITEDRVNIANRTDDKKFEVTSFNKFNPQWLHQKLSVNEEYRMRFQDRAYRHLQPGGVFSPSESLERINLRVKEVENAIIAESARWGDAKRPTGQPYTKNVEWQKEIDKIRNNFIPQRNYYLINQLKTTGLYPGFDTPVIKINGNPVNSSEIRISSQAKLDISDAASSGTLVYTLNGIDPRLPGGGINSTALFSASSVSIAVNSSMVVMARIYRKGKWSALKQLNIIMDQTDYSGLKITELHYHPPDLINSNDTISGQDLEFIEFKNVSRRAINLSGILIDSAVHYQFPEEKLLAPGRFFVVASKPSIFYEYYGKIASGNFSGNLSNGGEELIVKGKNNLEILRFSYSDTYPWPDRADGDGFSLASVDIDPDGDPASFEYWTCSVNRDGNPFADNVLTQSEDKDPGPAGRLFAFPNPGNGLFQIRFDSPDFPDKIDIGLIDVSGKGIMRTEITNPGILNLLDLHLPAGIYIIRTFGSKKFASLRIVII